MPDISMCMNEKCEKKDKCYRYTATPDEYWQPYCLFDEKDCTHFWDNKERSEG